MGNRKVKETENSFSNKTFFTFSVARGVRLMKDNDSNSAVLHFNKALATDPKCVDALVARGALSANQGHYKRAMQDFEDALKIDHKHINALKYLHDVLNNIANA
jgi:Tfp pilus assembly protein PilF